MAMESGARLGPYEVVAKLGEGGMGEVYRARDTKLGRDVALKILPASLASDPDRLMRFEREARTLAALNHPNIAAIYGIEEQGATRALVMELVEGEELSSLVARGPMAWIDARPVAIQIAEALEAAHEAGIVHRDLKPQNIKVKADGTVKVLDFGLAKALDVAPATSGSGTSAVTMTSPALTQMGVILGTAAYMSPEQAKARPVDRRADIWAFGVVLYEMLTARRLFASETIGETLAAVLRAEIDLSTLPAATPAAWHRLLARCLDRDPATRLQHIGEARIALGSTAQVSEPAPAGPSTVAWWQRPIAIAGIVAVAVAAGSLAGGWPWGVAPGGAGRAVLRVTLPVEAGHFAWSPDGSRLAYVAPASPGGPPRIFLRDMDQFEARELDTGDGVRRTLAFSPGGDWLAYSHAAPGSPMFATEIRRVRTSGGQTELVTPVFAALSLDWQGDQIFFSNGRQIQVVPAAGGTARTVAPVSGGQAEGVYLNVVVVNERSDLLFTFAADSGSRLLQAVPSAGGDPRTLLENVCNFAVTASGHLLYAPCDRPVLLGRRFDAATLEVGADEVPVVEPIPAGAPGLTVSRTGRMVYPAGEPSSTEFVWFTRDGSGVEPVDEALRGVQVVGLADRDRQFVLARVDGTGKTKLSAWDAVAKVERPILSRRLRNVTMAATSGALVWTEADGIFRLDAPWTGDPVPLPVRAGGSGTIVGLSGDGRLLILDGDGGVGPGAPAIVRADGTGTIATLDFGRVHQLSPDSRWLAYREPGTPSTIWLRPFPGVSTARHFVGNGAWIDWSPDSRELIYWQGDQWWSVTVRGEKPDAPFELGRPVAIRIPTGLRGIQAVSADRRRLLGTRRTEGPAKGSYLVEHFFEELRAKVPVK